MNVKKISGIILGALSAVALVFSLSCGPEKHLEDKMQWHKFTEVAATFPKGPKPIFFYIGEATCDNCMKMQKEVFSRPEIAWYLNANYYCINFDIATDLPVTIQGKLYNRDGFFQLFTNLTPSYYFFGADGEVQGMFQSEMDLKPFKQYLKYMRGGNFGKTTWEDWEKTREAETDTLYGIF